MKHFFKQTLAMVMLCTLWTVAQAQNPGALFMVGDGVGQWETGEAVKMSKMADGMYTAVLPYDKCTGDFKIRAYDSWNDEDPNKPYSVLNPSKNGTLSWSGNISTVNVTVNSTDNGSAFNFGEVPNGKSVQVQVNLTSNTKKVSFVVKPEMPNTLYLIGLNNNWNNFQSMTKKDGKYRLEGVSVDNDSEFQLLFANNWSNSKRIVPAANQNGENNLNFFNKECPSFYWDDAAFDKTDSYGKLTNFNIKKGYYNIEYDPEAEKLIVEPVGRSNIQFENLMINMWEGPVNEALAERLGLEGNAWGVAFEKDYANSREGVTVYKLVVVDNDKVKDIDPITFASQFWLHSEKEIKVERWAWDPRTGEYGQAVNINLNANASLFVDAHKTDKLVPVTTKFWCGNSRMEVGMKVKAIYFAIYEDELASLTPEEVAAGATPFRMLFSSTGNVNIDAEEQKPFNSDTYELTLTQGDLYNALKGTRTGTIKVPFARHAAAEEGYVINLGKVITLGADEPFAFQAYTRTGVAKEQKAFNVTAVNTKVDAINGSLGSISKGLSFNQIILKVNPDNYDDYYLWFRNSTVAGSSIPDGYDNFMRLPMLKIWAGNDAKWVDLFDKSGTLLAQYGETFYMPGYGPTNRIVKAYEAVEYLDKDGNTHKLNVNSPAEELEKHMVYYQEGNVKYFAFRPALKVGDGEALRTNLYHLDFGEKGIKVRNARKNGSVMDQFNILDQDGYDISNTYNGSQLIYPGAWWAGCPNLMDDEKGTREYNGHKFLEIPKLTSQVDLAWHTSDANADYDTIYDITLYKIEGKAYDVYTESENEMNMFYIYAENNKEKYLQKKAEADQVNDLYLKTRAMCERTSPILLRVWDKREKFEGNLTEHKTVRDETTAEFAGFNKPDHPAETKNYVMTLNSKSVEGNNDLNYVANGVKFVPGKNGKDALQFVDVTGTQRWAASGSEDELLPNKWCNYYTGSLTRDEKKLYVNKTATEYYKVVLATNPDQVRYQIMAPDISLEATPRLVYQPMSDESNGTEGLIYPVAKLTARVLWRDGYDKIQLNLNDVTGTKGTASEVIDITTKDPTKDPNVVLLPASETDAFYSSSEMPIDYILGDYHINPEKFSAQATAHYFKGNESSVDVLTSNVASAQLTLPEPVISEIAFEGGDPIYAKDDKGNWNDQVVVAGIKVSSDSRNFPRYYEVLSADVSGIDSVENGTELASDETKDTAYAKEHVAKYADTHTIGDSEILWGTYADNSNSFANVPVAMKVKGGLDTVEDGKLVRAKAITVAYWARAVYNFAVPESEGLKPIEKNAGSEAASYAANADSALDFTKIPEGLKLYQTFSTEGGAKRESNAGIYMPIAKSYDGVTTSIDNVNAENGPVEYYTIQGIRVENPTNGIYIRVQNGKSTKVRIP